jgi:hypothetical protein
MSLDTSARLNFSINKTKYPKVFEAISKWKQNRDVISNKICIAIEKELAEEEQEQQGISK